MAEMSAKPSWQAIVERKRDERQSCLPTGWLIPDNELPSDSITDITKICETSGWLNEQEVAITNLDLTDLAAAIREKRYTSVQVVGAFAHRATIAQQLVNVLTEINFEGARAQAEWLDMYLESKGEVVGPLHGVPICVKDQWNVKGLDSTAGYCAWAGRIAKQDSVTISALKEAGAVVLAKTNLAHTLLAGETVNPLWGRSFSPYNRKLTPGASSGGDAALLAMRGAAIGVETDSAGSIRVPANLCELWSLRPSAGRISMRGISDLLVGQESSKCTGGPLAHSARDLDLFMSAYCAQEVWKQDPEVLRMPWKRDDQGPFCFAIAWGDEFVSLHPTVLRGLRHVVQAIRASGHIVVDWQGPLKNDETTDLFEKFISADGGQQVKQQHDASGEPMYDVVADRLGISSGRAPLTVTQLWEYQHRRIKLAHWFADTWNATSTYSCTGRPIDGLISSTLASVSIPHTVGIPNARRKDLYLNVTLEPVLDLSSGTFPSGLRQDPTIDTPAVDFKPRSERDRQIQARYDDPEEWRNAPIGFQVTAQRLEEEKVVSMLMAIEKALAVHR